MKRFTSLFLILIINLLVACQPSEPKSVFTPTPEATLTSIPIPSVTSTALVIVGTMAPPSMPAKYGMFSDLSAAQKAARFALWLPGYVPDNLPFIKASVADYADGSENVSVLYSEPGDPLDANLKVLNLQIAETDQPITLDTVAHQFKVIARDVREVQVRGQTGFTYWSPGGAEGNSAHLDWREGTFNFSISLFGNWPQPDESNPHGLDTMLLQIAGSLKVGP
ncbi:MAG: hypothetical protein ABSB41_02675 [Anaerolineales bacterium]|jgi:hypothetical protein